MRNSQALLTALLIPLFGLPLLSTAAAAPFGATATPLLQSGPKGKKENLVIIGDGFQAGDQTTFNTYVDQVVLQAFASGPLMEDMNAFNITRVNVDSTDSGPTQVSVQASQVLVPDTPPDGTLVAFTFSGANAVAPTPFLHGVVITDPAGRQITDYGDPWLATASLRDREQNPEVTGSIDRNSGVVALNYAAGMAPPAGGAFSIVIAIVSTSRSTALDYRISRDHGRCWSEAGPNTDKRRNEILDALVPERNFTLIVLNGMAGGGCGWGTGQAVGTDCSSGVVSHEAGHMIGGLCDEYGGAGAYSGSEPGCVNMTMNTNRSTLKWRDFVDPATAIPTTFNAATMDRIETAGVFEGGLYRTTGVYRPHENAMMRSNYLGYGPVAYDRMKQVLNSYHDHNFGHTAVGDFDGDGRSDLVVHNANALELYLSDGTHQVSRWTQTLPLPGWDYFAKNDQFLVGDFDGDGRDDLFVYNLLDFDRGWLAMLKSVNNTAAGTFGFVVVAAFERDLPGWDKMKRGDRFFVGDFDGDGSADLYVVNTTRTDWAVGYLGMLHSTGTGLEMVRRYDEVLPGWDKMKANDKFFVANLDGQGGKDLYVFNASGDWKEGYLMPLISTGTELVPGTRYDKQVPGWDDLRRGDQFFVADFDGDGNEDLYVFNGTDWAAVYLGVMRSTGVGTVEVPILHEGYIYGWDLLKPHDTFWVANIEGLGRRDLYVSNTADWGATRYLGRLVARPDGFVGSFDEDQVGAWQLGSKDVFYVANINGQPSGTVPLDDLVAQNGVISGTRKLGLLMNADGNLTSGAIHSNWIHHYLYHASGNW